MSSPHIPSVPGTVVRESEGEGGRRRRERENKGDCWKREETCRRIKTLKL